MAETVAIGIIGCGNISEAYFRLSKVFTNVEIVACADVLPAAAKARAEQFGVRALSVDQFADGGGNACGRRFAECDQARARLHEHAIAMAVVAAIEFQDSVAMGEAARGPERAHHGFGAAAHEAQFFNEGHHGLDAARQHQPTEHHRAAVDRARVGARQAQKALKSLSATRAVLALPLTTLKTRSHPFFS